MVSAIVPRLVTRISSLLLLGVLHATIASANGGPAADELGVLIAQALLNNPEILVSEERLQMSTEKPRQADSFEDPMMMLKI